MNNIINYVITTFVGMTIGYLIKQFTQYKSMKSAIKGLLRAQMVNVYYEYQPQKKTSHYIKEAWLMNYEAYKELGGNSFIDTLKEDVEDWEVIK